MLVGFGPTLDFGDKRASNSAMSAALFALSQGLDAKRVRACTRARQLLNIVPISGPGLALIRNDALAALLARFEPAHVAPVFDFLRPSVI